ncbi:beta-glucosidase [Actinomarinicola tropica]|nr:glycoside hydrolase family 3 C-terminal domain-containing protein [Actinomarinicola tropica]
MEDQLTVPEACRLLGGASTWRTHPVERIGLPAIKMSDGPNGVRGDGLGTRQTPGVVIPAGIAVGATWDPDLVGELGDLLGTESIRKGAHVLLAPTVNLQRTPIGGRVFECMSEDPELTARLCVPYIRGVQAHDVAVTVKHFVVNDTEVDRMTVDVDADERVLRELYLRPFESAVREAGAWGVMSAYNQLHGEHCAANRWLLTEVLREEWGFDGFVVSDWFGSHDTVPSALAGLNVAMPGPQTIFGERLQAAVEAGDVPAERVLDLAADVLHLADRVHARELSSEREERTVDEPAERALCRRAAAAAMVLVRNDGTLPLDDDARVAVVGPNAADTRIMGGGSASLQPLVRRSILDAVTERFRHVVHETGVRIDRMPPPMTDRVLRTPDGRPGLLVTFRNGQDESTEPVTTEVAASSMLRFFGSAPVGVDPERFHVALEGELVPEVDGPHEISATLTGAGEVVVGDTVVLDDPTRSLPRGEMFFGQGAVEQRAVVDLRAGVPVRVRATSTGRGGFNALRIGLRPPEPADALERAVAAAADADVAVVVVGTNDEWETEGEDRTTIALPGRQDELVQRVAAANPRTVVVVNAGAPVAMPWIDDVAAVVIGWFGGQGMADAVADVLSGDVDPGGRSPITFPRRLEDTPAWPHYQPVDGIQRYGEGLRMGYRGFAASGTDPLVPFGHGLSYGTAEWGDASVASSFGHGSTDGDVEVVVEVPVRSVGDRAATVVVQGYLTAPDAPVERPARWLVAWDKLVVEPGGASVARLRLGVEAFRRWDGARGGWVVDPGRYELVVASSSAPGAEHQRVAIDVPG